MMLGLLPELKQLIAGKDQETWFRMWHYDPEFRSWTESEYGRKLFVELFTIAETNAFGTQRWKLFGKIHRENDDLPAVIWVDGMREWYRDGKLHRENDLPAVVWPRGRLLTFFNKSNLIHG